MTKLADLGNTITNAIHVLGKPTSRRWRVFDSVNGKLTAPQIATNIGIKSNHVANELRILCDKGLIEPSGKRGKAVIYGKIPELRSTNLRGYIKTGGIKSTSHVDTEIKTENSILDTTPNNTRTNSRAIDKVVSIGKKYGIGNIDQNWVDALVVLNFIETAATKFLMDHGYTEQQIKDNKMHWEDKINKLEAKLYEEAAKKGIKPRTSVLNVLKNYRTQRNDLDHEAHVASATIKKQEVDLLIKILDIFIQQVFEEHKQYCALNQTTT